MTTALRRVYCRSERDSFSLRDAAWREGHGRERVRHPAAVLVGSHLARTRREPSNDRPAAVHAARMHAPSPWHPPTVAAEPRRFEWYGPRSRGFTRTRRGGFPARSSRADRGHVRRGRSGNRGRPGVWVIVGQCEDEVGRVPGPASFGSMPRATGSSANSRSGYVVVIPLTVFVAVGPTSPGCDPSDEPSERRPAIDTTTAMTAAAMPAPTVRRSRRRVRTTSCAGARRGRSNVAFAPAEHLEEVVVEVVHRSSSPICSRREAIPRTTSWFNAPGEQWRISADCCSERSS